MIFAANMLICSESKKQLKESGEVEVCSVKKRNES